MNRSRGSVSTPSELRTQLAPVRSALLEDARSRAAGIIADAEREADATLAEARSTADEEVRRGEDRARSAARARSRSELERARAEASRLSLRARAETIRQLEDALHEAALGLRNDPRYPALLDHLEGLAVSQLGADVVIDRDPPDRGGIIARKGARHVDYSLAALADRALSLLGDEIEQLWG